MTDAKFTNEGLKMFDRFGQFDEPESPFEKHGEVIFAKFDALKIVNAVGGNSVDVLFNWHGTAILRLRVEGTQIKIDTELNIGIEGRQRVFVTTD